MTLNQQKRNRDEGHCWFCLPAVLIRHVGALQPDLSTQHVGHKNHCNRCERASFDWVRADDLVDVDAHRGGNRPAR